MKRNIVSFAVAVSLGLLLPSAVFAAGSGASNSDAKSTTQHAMFNRSTIETVQGKVEGITSWKGKKAKTTTEWLSLKTDHGTMPVLLGPSSYVNNEKVKIHKGDDVSVTGSGVMMHKKTELVATEIKKGNETLNLRNSDGTPLWSAKTMQGK